MKCQWPTITARTTRYNLISSKQREQLNCLYSLHELTSGGSQRNITSLPPWKQHTKKPHHTPLVSTPLLPNCIMFISQTRYLLSHDPSCLPHSYSILCFNPPPLLCVCFHHNPHPILYFCFPRKLIFSLLFIAIVNVLVSTIIRHNSVLAPPPTLLSLPSSRVCSNEFWVFLY